MATKEKSLNIHQRLNAVMADVNYIKKDKKIEIGKGSYSVTGHDAVTKLIHPLLVEHGINIIPECVAITQEGNRVRADMEFTWVNIDNPEDCIIKKWSAYGMDSQHDKAIGKAYSYAQRLMTLKTLHIQSGDNDDVLIQDCEDGDEEFKAPKQEKKPTISKNQQKEFIDHIKARGMKTFVAIDLINSHGFKMTKDIHVDKLEALKKEVTLLTKEALDA